MSAPLSLEPIGHPRVTSVGIEFEAAAPGCQPRRFLVTALALDELERGRAAPCNWEQVFGAHLITILQVATQALDDALPGDPIVLGMGHFVPVLTPTGPQPSPITASAIVP